MAKRLREVEEAVERDEIQLLRAGTAIGLVIAGAAVAGILLLGVNRPAPTQSGADAPVSEAAFTPPPMSAIPPGPEGEAIKRGMALFDNPRVTAAQFVGNGMACKNCHLDSGRRANSSPMWAAWVSYPQYRKKSNSINTMYDRIEACFRYSMNAPNSAAGGPPPAGSDIYRDLESYFHWLAKGAPTGQPLPGAGYPKPQLSAAGYDPARGSAIFAASCVACHGTNGQGASQPNGTVVYPPLWGPRSYNWGAGMARVDLAAGFIKANMPFDKPGSFRTRMRGTSPLLSIARNGRATRARPAASPPMRRRISQGRRAITGRRSAGS